MLWLFSGLFAPLPSDSRYGAILAIAVVAVLRDAGVAPFASIPLPQNRRQVPQDVLQRDLPRGAARFGFELGTGVRTFVSATAPYVVAVALLLANEGPLVALLTGLGFGLGRAATPLLRYASGAGEPWDERLRTRLRAITVSASGLSAVAFLVLAG